MKLLYPEIEAWVYNMQKRDLSINMLRMSLSLPGMLKMSRVMFPPRKLSPHMKGTKLLFLFVTSGGQTDWCAGFPFKCLYFSRGMGQLHCLNLPHARVPLPLYTVSLHHTGETIPLCAFIQGIYFPRLHFLHMIAATPTSSYPLLPLI